MYPNGYIKVYMDNRVKTDVGTVTGVNAMGVQMLVEDDEVEILEQRSRIIRLELPQPDQQQLPPGPPDMPPQPGMPPPGQPGMPPQQMPPQQMQPPQAMGMPQESEEIEVFDLKIRTTKEILELRLEACPPEEVLVDNDLTTLNLDEADFVCHRVQKTYTQLVTEGFDPDELDEVGSGENYQWNDERTNRLFYEDEDPDAEDEDDPSMRQFWVHECYVWFDYNGDGLGEQRRVVLIGDRVFENEETNYQPLIAMSAILMQHKHTGMGYIDLMKDLQLLGSVLTRQLLDSIYKMNIRKKFISEDSLTEDGATMEAMLNTQAEFVPVRGIAANAIMPDQQQSMVSEILPVLQYLDERLASRTGVTPESGVSANDLQEVRQEVFSNVLDRASQRIEMLVRIFSETGYRQLMLKVHQLLRSHWDIARTVKLRGEWVDVDPQGWRDRTDMTVNTGLGHNTKQIQLGLLTQLLDIQKEAAAEGLSDPAKIYNTLEKLVGAAGVGDARLYFVDPKSDEYQPPEPPPPDANMILAQAQADALGKEQERKGQEMQINAQNDQQKMQIDAMSSQQDNQLKQTDQQIKMRELAMKESEMIAAGQLKEGELAERAAKIRNIEADTQVKYASADKTMAEATVTAIEGGETYQKALDIVSKSGEQADAGGPAAEFESEDDDGDSSGQTEPET